jgi:hypothetical protein
MTGDFLAMPRRARRWRVIAAIVVAIAFVVVVWAIVPHRARPVPHSGPGLKATAVPTGSASSLPSTSPRVAPLRLVEGRRSVDGVRVGYPQTVAGAVSAGVEYWTRLGSTLDPGEARRIGRRVAVRSWTSAGDDLAKATSNTRRQLGVPGTGVLPPGTSVSLGPVAFQLRDETADQMTVLLLGYLITTTPSAGTQSRLGVFPAVLRFDRGDWRIANDTDGDNYANLAASPGSDQARALGWRDFLE